MNPVKSIVPFKNLIKNTLTPYTHTHRTKHTGRKCPWWHLSCKNVTCSGGRSPAEMAFAHIHSYTYMHRGLHAHKYMGLLCTMKDVKEPAKPLVKVCTIHYILCNTWAICKCDGGLVFSLMLIWQKTDWDITAKARGNQPAQVRCISRVCVSEGEREREKLSPCSNQGCQIKKISDWPLYLKVLFVISRHGATLHVFGKLRHTLIKSASWEPAIQIVSAGEMCIRWGYWAANVLALRKRIAALRTYFTLIKKHTGFQW